MDELRFQLLNLSKVYFRPTFHEFRLRGDQFVRICVYCVVLCEYHLAHESPASLKLPQENPTGQNTR